MDGLIIIVGRSIFSIFVKELSHDEPEGLGDLASTDGVDILVFNDV